MTTEKSILITGCSSGIGACCAHGLKERGWRVFATARKPDDIARLEHEGFEAFYLDYTEPDSIAAVTEAVMERTDGQLFALFNNGAYGQGGAVEDVRTDVLRAQFEANVFGYHDLIHRLLPTMIANGHGRIVQCSSLLGFVAVPFRGPYAASKFALEALSQSLRQELHGTGVHVSVIEPGPIAAKFDQSARAMLRRTIDIDASRFAARYHHHLDGDETGRRRDPNARWRLGPEAVLTKLIHAVESSNPKPRYFVTTPAYLMEIARRVLPRRLLDRLCRAVV